MESTEILTRLRSLMKHSSEKEMDWDTVTSESTIESLGFDSLTVLDLVYDIQKEFGTRFDLEELANTRTVEDLVSFLQKRTQ